MLRTSLLGLAGLTLLAPTDLYLEPPAGADLTRSFELSLEGGVDDVTVTIMGEEQDFDQMVEGAALDDLRGEVAVDWSAADTLGEVERGRILALERRYGAFLVDGEEQEWEDYEVRSARFTWDADEGEYAIEVLDEDATDEQREWARSLRADMDHAHLLPEGAIEVGDSWTVELPGARMLELLLPGQDVREAIERSARMDEEVDAEEFEEVLEAILELLEDAELTLTYAGDEELDGVPCAVLDLALECSGSGELGELIQDIQAEGAEGLGDAELELSVELLIEAEGRLFWHREEHRLHRLELEGEAEAELIGGTELDTGDFVIPIDFEAEFSGGFGALHTVE
jgi:hypothetical protein